MDYSKYLVIFIYTYCSVVSLNNFCNLRNFSFSCCITSIINNTGPYQIDITFVFPSKTYQTNISLAMDFTLTRFMCFLCRPLWSSRRVKITAVFTDCNLAVINVNAVALFQQFHGERKYNFCCIVLEVILPLPEYNTEFFT